MKSVSWPGVGWALLVFCSLSLWIGYDQYRGALMNPDSFHRAQGKITLSRITSYQRRKKPFGRETVYDFDIRYQYTVEGRDYESQRVSFDLSGSHRTPDLARSFTRKYPMGQSVTVFYRPGEPSFSFLEPGNKGRSLMVFVVVISLWVVGLMIVVAHHSKQFFRRENEA